MKIDQAFKVAIRNVAELGDTDVLPYPIENAVFFDMPAETAHLLKQIHKDVDSALMNYPPVNENMLAAVGYTGFRWVTQVDPLWNAYFLALVVSVGQQIEDARLPVEQNVIFSYRWNVHSSKNTIFDPTIGWYEFNRESIRRAKTLPFVLVCDISDFYPRIYHHRLENALQIATKHANACHKIMTLLDKFQKNVSYGLPVGGPAARTLSELLLNRVDRLLTTNEISFCRFADDYHIFANSAEEAYKHLVFLSEKLFENEGMLLQKTKTRVMSSEEFISTSEFRDTDELGDSNEEETRAFLRIRLRYDPYSQTAAEDYEALKDELSKFDVTGMLAREMRKSRVHQALTKRLIAAIQYLSDDSRDAALLSLMDSLPVIYPVFPSVILLAKSIIQDVDPETRSAVFAHVRKLISTESYIVMVPTHLAYAVRLLAHDTSDEAGETLNRVYQRTENTVIKRDVILAMARRGADFWISDKLKTFGALPGSLKTSLVVSSYILGDEGAHWRRSIKKTLTPLQSLVSNWAATKSQIKGWQIPL